MPSLLFIVQQWLRAFSLFWPIWALLSVLVLFGILQRKHSPLFLRLGVALASTFVVIIFGIRGAFLLLFPYTEQSIEYTERNLPLVVRISGADVAVSTDSVAEEVVATVLGSGVTYSFRQDEYTDEKGESPATSPVTLFSQTSARNMLTSFWHKIDLRLPSNLAYAQYYELTQSNAKIDLRPANATDFSLVLFYGDLQLQLPNSAGKTIRFQGGSEFSGSVEVDRSGASMRIIDPFGVIEVGQISVERVGPTEFLIKGQSAGESVFVVTAANSATSVGALELREVNQHNE